jgi:DNA-binding response OmpR family regulator
MNTTLPYITDPRPVAKGGLMTAFDLPRKGERKRWTRLYKTVVAEALKANLISAEEAAERYAATVAELMQWIKLLEAEGPRGLSANNFLADYAPEAPTDMPMIQDGPIVIDFIKKTVRLNEQLVDLAPLEFKILSILVRGAPNVVTRADLFALLYSGRERMPESKILDVLVHHVRSKLGRGCIETVWGRGWTWKGIAS